jgi:hypothetical protein
MINNKLYCYIETSNSFLGNNVQDQICRPMQIKIMKIKHGFKSKQHILAIIVNLQQAYAYILKNELCLKIRDM